MPDCCADGALCPCVIRKRVDDLLADPERFHRVLTGKERANLLGPEMVELEDCYATNITKVSEYMQKLVRP